MKPVNLNTDKHVIVYYPGGAGGKFLINCLSFAPNVVMFDQDLVNLTDPLEKYHIVLDRLNSVTTSWNDLLMSSADFMYGSHGSIQTVNRNTVDLMKNTGIVKQELINSIAWPDHIISLSNQDRIFFSTAHSIDELFVLTKIWPNSTIINFVNHGRFVNQYRPWRIEQNTNLQDYNSIFRIIRKLKTQWNSFKEISWSNMPVDTSELKKLSIAITTELKLNAPKFLEELQHACKLVDFYKNLNSDSLNTVKVKTWNTEWYLDKQLTTNNLLALANNLGIELSDSRLITEYHNKWIETLTHIKDFSLSKSRLTDMSLPELNNYILLLENVLQTFPVHKDTKTQNDTLGIYRTAIEQIHYRKNKQCE